MFLFSEWTKFFSVGKELCGATLFFPIFYTGKGLNFAE
jgi:hypothetical protein